MRKGVVFRSGVATRFLVIMLLAAAFQSCLLARVTAQPVLVGHYFDYDFKRWVTNGANAYEDYYDETTSKGHYDFIRQNSTHVYFRAQYSWKYYSNEGLNQAGEIDRGVEFVLFSRLYSTRTDLDEWDSVPFAGLTVWFWIPTEVQVSDRVKILDEYYTVTNVDATIWSNLAPKKAIELRGEGTGSRDDDYGRFSISWKDVCYFDKVTGFIIADRWSEHDSGFWQGQQASFDLFETFDVTGSSYEVALDYPSLLILGLLVGLTVFLTFYVCYRYRWRARNIPVGKYVAMETRIYRVRRLDKFPRMENRASEYLGAFLADFANKALLSKEVVAVAVSEFTLVGLGTYNREAKIGMILCKDTGVTETLRKFIGAKDFFTEVRHKMPEGLSAEASIYGVRIASDYTYNVFETYQVVAANLEGMGPFGYDTTLVRRMTSSDLKSVAEVARKVYKVRSSRWIKGQFLSKDVAFVAVVDGRIVGFAFATFTDGHGRLHTATVLPAYRNKGIGRELLRARLNALINLGAADAIAEVADWNMPSLHLLWSHGFRSKGTMQVETARRTRIKKNIVRR